MWSWILKINLKLDKQWIASIAIVSKEQKVIKKRGLIFNWSDKIFLNMNIN